MIVDYSLKTDYVSKEKLHVSLRRHSSLNEDLVVMITDGNPTDRRAESTFGDRSCTVSKVVDRTLKSKEVTVDETFYRWVNSTGTPWVVHLTYLR